LWSKTAPSHALQTCIFFKNIHSVLRLVFIETLWNNTYFGRHLRSILTFLIVNLNLNPVSKQYRYHIRNQRKKLPHAIYFWTKNKRRGDGNKPFLPNLNLSKLYISVDAELKTESFRSHLTSPEFVHSHANLEILSFFFII
jgi:hypothetical protein